MDRWFSGAEGEDAGERQRAPPSPARCGVRARGSCITNQTVGQKLLSLLGWGTRLQALTAGLVNSWSSWLCHGLLRGAALAKPRV